MPSPDIPVTTAVRFLRGKKIPFEPFFYDYEEHGGTRRASEALAADEHTVVKTLVMETGDRSPLIVLMHGDREISTRQLARALGVKQVAPCDPATASRHTGYIVGGTSPFGTRKPLPVYAESTIFDLPRIYVNGGKRGFLVAIDPCALQESLHPVPVSVAIDASAPPAL
jgi:Cys-tRNA(Pro) deacylase